MSHDAENESLVLADSADLANVFNSSGVEAIWDAWLEDVMEVFNFSFSSQEIYLLLWPQVTCVLHFRYTINLALQKTLFSLIFSSILINFVFFSRIVKLG